MNVLTMHLLCTYLQKNAELVQEEQKLTHYECTHRALTLHVLTGERRAGAGGTEARAVAT